MVRLAFLLMLSALLMGSCMRERVDGYPPPAFENLEELDRTPDPACETSGATGARWVAGVRGRVIDTQSDRGVEGATIRHCLRGPSGEVVCTDPTPEDGATTDDDGWYGAVLPEELRCADRLSIEVSPPEPGLGPTYCPVPLDPDDGVQLLPHPAILPPVSLPEVLMPFEGDGATARFVVFLDSELLELVGVIPDALTADVSLLELRAGSMALDPRLCFLPTDPEAPEILALWAFAPSFGSTAPVTLRVHVDTDLPEGTVVTLFALGGLDTVLGDGSRVPTGELAAFAKGVVEGGSLVTEVPTSVPSTSLIAWALAPSL